MEYRKEQDPGCRVDKASIHAIVPFINECNLHCYYCCAAEELKTADASAKRLGRNAWRSFVRFFDTVETGRWIVHVTSGEPFCHPEFVDFAEAVTRKNRINIGTNLSHNLQDFIRRVPPDRVTAVACTLQPEMESRLDDFIKRLLLLKKHNYKIQLAFVMAPSRFHRYSEYRRILLEKTGLRLVPSPFIWRSGGAEYPRDYSEEEKEFLLENCYSPVRAAIAHVSFPLRETNKVCATGFNSVAMDMNGDIFRCHDRWEGLGNIHAKELRLYSRPRKCRQRVCMCPSTLAVKAIEARYEKDYYNLPIEEKRRLMKKAISLLQPRKDYESFWRNLEKEYLRGVRQELEKKSAGRKVVLAPAGVTTQMLLGVISDTIRKQIVGVADKRPDIAARKFPGIPVVSHEEIDSLNPDAIVILSERHADELARKFEHFRGKGVECIVNPVPFYSEDGYKVF